MNNENENDDDDDEGRDRDKWRGEGLIGRRERWGGKDLRPGTLMSRLQLPCHERERKHPLHCITALRQHTISLHFTSILLYMLSALQRSALITRHLTTTTTIAPRAYATMTDPSKYLFNHTMLRSAWLSRPNSHVLQYIYCTAPTDTSQSRIPKPLSNSTSTWE